MLYPTHIVAEIVEVDGSDLFSLRCFLFNSYGELLRIIDIIIRIWYDFELI